jgi:hypothetical protein
MVPHFRFILTLLAVQTSRDRMATKADRDYLTLLAGRILETESARANALREFKRLDDLLTTMQTNFNKLANRAAPVYSIPNEILSAIFEAACFPRSRWPLDFFEIKFSHVTHHWRDVAVNTPRLWTEIKVFGMKNSLDMVEAYLTRSKSIPLDMKVYLTIRSQSTPSVIQAICSHVGRWRRLSVACGASHRELLSLLFRSLHSQSVPLLELVFPIINNDQTMRFAFTQRHARFAYGDYVAHLCAKNAPSLHGMLHYIQWSSSFDQSLALQFSSGVSSRFCVIGHSSIAIIPSHNVNYGR